MILDLTFGAILVRELAKKSPEERKQFIDDLKKRVEAQQEIDQQQASTLGGISAGGILGTVATLKTTQAGKDLER